MQTETDIMKNLNLHLNSNKQIQESEVINDYNPHKGNFKKHGTVSEVEQREKLFVEKDTRKRNYTTYDKRRKFNPNYGQVNHQSNYTPIDSREGKISPLPGISQKGPLKESHFFDMIDQIQKESEQLESRKKLFDQQTERNWYESISRKDPY
jgi:hypothetical protein